ncbi:hypothetical protein [Streptomyces sp. NPDC046862]|uniref:hypothetical protein n=1 Tax=Streptomyces sp. NPDC046862 TaxID=3154603 RepID=UPI0034525604
MLDIGVSVWGVSVGEVSTEVTSMPYAASPWATAYDTQDAPASTARSAAVVT